MTWNINTINSVTIAQLIDHYPFDKRSKVELDHVNSRLIHNSTAWANAIRNIAKVQWESEQNEPLRQTKLFICYQTDRWLSKDSMVAIYVGIDKEDCIAQLQAYREMTEEQAEQVREKNQSQGNNLDYEWFFDEVLTNAFCD